MSDLLRSPTFDETGRSVMRTITSDESRRRDAIHIELIVAPGCPHAEAARALVAECVNALKIDVEITCRVDHYPSPTVLVDGVDVMRPEVGAGPGDVCRLDLPTAQSLIAALSASHGNIIVREADAATRVD